MVWVCQLAQTKQQCYNTRIEMEEIKFSTGRRWLKLKGQNKKQNLVTFSEEHQKRLVDDSRRMNISKNLLINRIVSDYYIRQDEVNEHM